VLPMYQLRYCTEYEQELFSSVQSRSRSDYGLPCTVPAIVLYRVGAGVFFQCTEKRKPAHLWRTCYKKEQGLEY
jgi:hypothetical protein